MPKNIENRIVRRQPIIAVMGHIDHGKSTLLDFIRKSNTTSREVGGITQHMGAYEATYVDKSGTAHPLTFLDTPGHEAFGGIRERSARAADIAILVVSGEDGVKPQTLEALKRIRDSKVPFVIAINKIDRPGVDLERIKGNLAEHEVYVEGYGGDVPWVAISALVGTGVADLLEVIVLMADMQNLSGDPSKDAEGIVIEANIDPKKGKTATLIIKDGTLKVGSTVVAGESFSPVRAIEDPSGKHIEEAACGRPVRIVGWNTVPVVGETFKTVGTRKEAEALVALAHQAAAQQLKTADDIVREGTVVVPIAIKTDTVGSLEAVKHEIGKISIEGIAVKVLIEGVGAVNENDIKTVSGSNSPIVLGFNAKVDAQAKAVAERMAIPVMQFDIIYRLAEWLAEELAKRRPRVEVEEEIGRAKVLKLFSSDKGRYVIGGKVESGSIQNGSMIKIMRRDAEVARGKIKSLQQLKSKVDEIATGKEFGAQIESKIEPAPGDRLEAFIVVTK